MSRIGKNPVTLPQGVEATLNGSELSMKGPKGTLSMKIHHDIEGNLEGDTLSFAPKRENDARQRALWGTTRALANNMAHGVKEGYAIDLKLVGVGYRAQAQGNKLTLSVGYSHPVEMTAPEGLTVAVTENTNVRVEGIDKQAVGEFAANIRAKRKPEPYKGKGIRYANEHIVMKEGKKK